MIIEWVTNSLEFVQNSKVVSFVNRIDNSTIQIKLKFKAIHQCLKKISLDRLELIFE